MDLDTQPVQLGEHTWALGGPFAWVYLVRAPRAVLLDTGMTFMARLLIRQIRQILGSQPLWGIVHTHSHFDHLGCTAQLCEAFAPAFVAAHPRVQKVLDNPTASALIAMLNDQLGALAGPDAPRYSNPPELSPVVGGETIDLGDGCSLRVWDTPGHTRDSISLEVLPDKLVVVGEATGVPISSLDHIQVEFLTSWQDYIAGIETVQRLQPEHLGLPHQYFASGADVVARYLTMSLQATHAYVARMQRYMAEAHGDFQAVFDRIYREDYSGGQIGQPEPAYRLNLEAQVRLMQRQYQPNAEARV